MKKLLLISALCLFAAPAFADDVIHLPGNAKVVPGNDGRVIYRGYDPDDLIYRRIINPYALPRERIRNIPTNDYSAICGGTNRASERRRCRKDVQDLDKDRGELYRKYND